MTGSTCNPSSVKDTPVRFTARFSSLLLASVLALGVAAAPAVSAEAAPATRSGSASQAVVSGIQNPTTSAAKTVAASKKKAKTGAIRVQLKTPAGKALKVAKVGLYLVTSGKFHRAARTNKSGIATFSKVPSGVTYYLGTFDDTKDPKLAYVQANAVAKVVAKKTKKVTLKLAAKVKLSGHVVDNHGAAVGVANVSLATANGTVVQRTKTAADGSYSFPYMRGGTYLVSFNKYDRSVGNTAAEANYSGGYWRDASDYDSATMLKTTVQTSKTAATRLTNLDATLTKFTSITGTSNLPADNNLITFTNPLVFVKSVFVVDSKFSLALPPATYLVSFTIGNVEYFYTGAGTEPTLDKDKAVAVTLTSNADVAIVVNGPTAAAPTR